jgi:hypothetical protein
MAGRSTARILTTTPRAGLMVFGILIIWFWLRTGAWSANADIQHLSNSDVQSDLCVNLFNHGYLDSLGPARDDLCVDGSTSEIICYKTRIALDTPRDDIFCMVGSAVVDTKTSRISVDCLLKDEKFKDDLPRYMYATSIADGFDAMHLDRAKDKPVMQNCRHREETLVLVRREGAYHTWDCLLEIFSYYLTVRFMQSEGLLTADSDLQVVFLDEHPNGPYAHLWAMFSRKPPIRRTELWRNGDTCIDRIIPWWE